MTKPATEPQATPDTYGIDWSMLGHGEKETWTNQQRFLEAYAVAGTIRSASPVAQVGRETVRLWQKGDVFSFRARFEAAQEKHADHLEDIMFSRIEDPQGNRGSDVLVIFAVKAAKPDKYREAVVFTDDTSKDVLKQLQAGRTKRTTTEEEAPETKAPTPIEAMRERVQGDG